MQHEAEIVPRASTLSLPAAGPQAGALTNYPIALFATPPAAQPAVYSVRSFKLEHPLRADAVARESNSWRYQFGAGIDFGCETTRICLFC